MDLPVQGRETVVGGLGGFADGEGWGGDIGDGDPGALVCESWSSGGLNNNWNCGSCGGGKCSLDIVDNCACSGDSARGCFLRASHEG